MCYGRNFNLAGTKGQKMSKDRFKFRVWVPVLYYNKNGDDCETIMCIENATVYSDGAVGCSENDLDTAIINLNLSELEETSVRDYIEANYSTESDLWYFFDNANIIKEQCTGLKDKSGNLIYEGDIVLAKHSHKSRPGKFIVKWGQGGVFNTVTAGFWLFDFSPITLETARKGDDFPESSEIEIIGNVHEQAKQKD